MNAANIGLVAVVGVISGAANVLAGAGALLTYPILIAVGLPPVAANVTNDVGIIPGNLSGVVGLRRSLGGQHLLLRRLVPGAMLGSLVGAAVLLLIPGSAFAWIAPPALLAASLLTLAQPALARRSARHREGRHTLAAAIIATSTYGGYFGTGIGLIFMGVLSVLVDDTPARLNAVKTVLQFVTNGLAGIVFALVAPVHWLMVAALAAGSLSGAQLGARLAGHLSAGALRAVIAVIGILASAVLLVQQAA